MKTTQLNADHGDKMFPPVLGEPGVLDGTQSPPSPFRRIYSARATALKPGKIRVVVGEHKDPLDALLAKTQALSKDEATSLLAQALFHLRCLSGSRNSFTAETLEAWQKAGLGFPSRDSRVQAAHHAAAEFIAKHDVC